MIRNYATMHGEPLARAGGSMVGYPTRLSTMYATSREQRNIAYSDVLGGSMVGEPISWT